MNLWEYLLDLLENRGLLGLSSMFVGLTFLGVTLILLMDGVIDPLSGLLMCIFWVFPVWAGTDCIGIGKLERFGVAGAAVPLA